MVSWGKYVMQSCQLLRYFSYEISHNKMKPIGFLCKHFTDFFLLKQCMMFQQHFKVKYLHRKLISFILSWLIYVKYRNGWQLWLCVNWPSVHLFYYKRYSCDLNYHSCSVITTLRSKLYKEPNPKGINIVCLEAKICLVPIVIVSNCNQLIRECVH